jgi:DNA-binding transcriptional LysR family regulator
MFQLRHLRTFLAAAETLSFTKAAERVHLSQPSVTGQIQSLEDAVGRPLFVRSNNKLALTEAGHHLVIRARALLSAADDALLAVRTNADATFGSISVAAPHTLCATLLAPSAARYAHGHPDVHLSVQEKNSSETERAVLDRTVDIGLVHGWPRAPRSRLQVEVISRDRPMVLMPLGHAVGADAAVQIESLASTPLLLTSDGCRYREYAQAILQHASVRPSIRGEADSVASLMRMVAAGLGVSVLPGKAIDLAGAPYEVEVRPLAGADEGLPICMLSAAGEPVRPQAAAFMEIVRKAARGSDEPVPALDVKHGSRREAAA